MSDSMRPHRRQPTRLRGPWDPPGKNTGVGCHFLLQCMKVKSESGVAQSCLTLSDPMDCSLPGSSVHGSFQARVLEWGAIAFSKEVSTDLFSSSLIFSLAMLSLQMSHWRHVLFLLIWLSILDFPADSFFYTFHVSDGLAFWLFMFVFFPLEPLS